MKLRYTPAATKDLSSIWDYSAEHWSPDQADRYVLELEASCEALALRKLSGRPADEFRYRYLRLRSGSHYIFYRQHDDGGVDIIRVLHERMNFSKHLKK
ncbi:MAG: type II toxin-antitoxin system RelE/ParE family toxin [Pseudaminobacter sp.]|nr:type II toxin-antitoxin system RelE/ParE family toxin [Pseudaminobacter sp.]